MKLRKLSTFSRLDRWTPAISLALVLAALLACKRKKAEPEVTPTAAVTAAPPPGTQSPAATVAPGPSANPNAPKLGDVKRYPDKEKKEDEIAVKILEDDVKVFNEADVKTQDVATLPKDLVVVRLASLEQEGFTLVDFPSGIGQFAPGWVESKYLEAKGKQVERDKVLAQEKKANIQPATKPAVTASASAKPAGSVPPKASATPAASTSAAIAAAAKSAAALASAAKSAAAKPIDAKAATAAAQKAAADAQKAASGTGGTTSTKKK